MRIHGKQERQTAAKIAVARLQTIFKGETMTLKEINSIQSPEDFTNVLGFSLDKIDVSHRGGGVGFSCFDAENFLEIDNNLLPRNNGAYCNYLGGGLRGSICLSNYSPKIKGRKKILLDAILQACKRIYFYIESPLNEEEDSDGETNWDAVGTAAVRRAGVKSAY